MSRQSIIAHHLILTCYGHWPPNDLRGSGSTEFRNAKFEPLGPIHIGRKPHHRQPSRDELREYHEHAQQLLKHPLVWIDDALRKELAATFANVIATNNYTCYACAILRNHAHFVMRIHRDRHDVMMQRLMDGSAVHLRSVMAELFGAEHPVWAQRPYSVFLYTPEDVHRTIRYVMDNPLKHGLPSQQYDFMKVYDNWPLHK